MFYAAHGKLLEPVIREQMLEVRASANIEIYTVHVKVGAGPRSAWVGHCAVAAASTPH